MRQRKLHRCEKRQRGQFMTPKRLAEDIVRTLDFRGVSRVLEPSCGDGSFVGALLDRIVSSSAVTPDSQQAGNRMTVVGVEIDSGLLDRCRQVVALKHSGTSHCHCKLIQGDFYRIFMERRRFSSGDHANPLAEKFDLIIGNPPFGGSFPPDIEDELDAMLGNRNGLKIKKETYAFFIVACTELLRPGGRLLFICSDSLLTIPTMTGLRQYLMENGKIVLHELSEFSDETSYPMLVIEYVHHEASGIVQRFGVHLGYPDVQATANLSWGVTPELAMLFRGPKLGDLFVASSGMTTGKNEYFVREISRDNSIDEPFDFRFYDAPVSVEYETERARLNRLPRKRITELREAQRRGETERRVAIESRDRPSTLLLPHDDYRPYNKANGRIVYSAPTHVIYWKNEGEVVLTYKRTGNWYLRGVGGQPFFGREGLTWQLIASRFVARYLPSGYILDSGAPCAFTRDGVDRSEIYFVLGWLLSDLAKDVLKTVINHTMNIQSKDFERMPYPWWVSARLKEQATFRVAEMVREAQAGKHWKWTDRDVRELSAMYQFREFPAERESQYGQSPADSTGDRSVQLSLL